MNRLFRTRCIIEPAEESIGGPPPQATVETIVDLEEVIRLRQNWDFEKDAPAETVLVDFNNGICAEVTASLEEIAEAWKDYRTHADALARIRN